jgi:hypothetical protein
MWLTGYTAMHGRTLAAQGSVASDAGAEASMPMVDLFSVRGRQTAAPQFTRGVC